MRYAVPTSRPGPGWRIPVLFLLGLAAVPAPLPAADLAVTADGAGPFPTIQSAVDAAAPGDTISLGPGTYRESVTVSEKHLLIRSAGGEDPPVIDARRVSRALTLIRTGNPVVLDGLSIRGGRAGGQFPNDRGGAVAALACPLIVRDCRFDENFADLGPGGAIYCTVTFLPGVGGPLPLDDPAEARLLVERCRFTGNIAGNVGGGVFVDDAPLTVVESIFVNNRGVQGGGVSALSQAATLVDCSFEDNRANTHGAGVHLSGQGPFFLTRVNFLRNQADKLGGAALVEVSGQTDFTDCLFLDNVSGFEGGAINARTSGFSVSGCLFAGNQAGGDGGGGISVLNLEDGVVSRSTFVENQAPAGASVLLQGSTLVFDHCLIADSGESIRCRPSSSVGGECNAGTPGAGGCLPMEAVDAVTRCASDPGRLCSLVETGACGSIGRVTAPCPAEDCGVPVLPASWGAIKRRW